MKTLIVTISILLSGLWLFYATIIPSVMRTRAMSHAMQLETELKNWADEKISQGKLTQDDVQEIFPDDYSLRFGGESPTKNFREMMEHVAVSSAPPIWPFFIIAGVGIVAAFRFPSPPKVNPNAEGD